MPGEFELIARHFVRPTPQTLLGPGDDCALLAPAPGMELAVSTDMLVEGTHFFAGTDPWQLGWKTLAVNLSDLAAMGAQPRWVFLAGSLPSARDDWLEPFSAGFFACANDYAVDLAGGDTTRGPLNLCVTVIGELPAGSALRRDRAMIDDDLWISGRPGRAALGLAHLQERVRLPEPLERDCVAALQRPQPRVRLGLTLRQQRLAHAAIDVSDGLLGDLQHLLDRSRLAAEIRVADLPPLPAGVDATLARHCQLAGGDDYELLFSAATQDRDQLAHWARQLDLPLWRIGRLLAGEPGKCTVIAADGHPLPIDRRGFDHFG
ncbi:MAG TPA: thiamine-phosphate kinase [Accumulibacter sp.]|nr:thiamine-phosphate kinase [Accumulibacter sp.]HMW17397.1 thiamine-phosphate kinase [Accumulibacter sp.]HNC17832.1 thiamine-phosphate kinase [Accumulibacter sp.]HND80123.1 thiamine-phosphate kinase [Accumulibacter sp.]HNE12838.1 thiamine-phosphate kinase [Accumulibacter sp.]